MLCHAALHIRMYVCMYVCIYIYTYIFLESCLQAKLQVPCLHISVSALLSNQNLPHAVPKYSVQGKGSSKDRRVKRKVSHTSRPVNVARLSLATSRKHVMRDRISKRHVPESQNTTDSAAGTPPLALAAARLHGWLRGEWLRIWR